MGRFDLSGRVAVVTGGASGIGAGICNAFAEAGAHVVVADVQVELGRQVAARLAPAGLFAATNVADLAAVEATVARAVAEFGRLDVFVNCAGVIAAGTVLETAAADWDRLFDVNARGVCHGCQAAVAQLLRQEPRGGVILNIASVAALVGLKRRFAYSATKGAVLAMTRALAADYLQAGIRCNAICPGTIHTPLLEEAAERTFPGRRDEALAAIRDRQPIGRWGEPADIAGMAVYLASDAASFITGATMVVDGGATML